MSDPVATNEIRIVADTSQATQSIGELSKLISGPLEDAVTSTVANLEGAFVDFARTGEINIHDMVNAIIADLARIAFNSFIKDPLTDLLSGLADGFANVLVSGFSSGTGTRALGGPVSFGRPYVVGEQGRELFVPETSGRIIPNHGLGGGGIVFNVQATDAQSFRRSESQIAAMLHRVASRGQRNL